MFQAALIEMNLTEEILRIEVRRQMALQQFIDSQIAPRVAVSEKEVASFYNRNPEYFTRPEATYAYDEIKDVIAEDLKQRRIQEEVGLYITRLEASADVKRFLQ
jgi:hypothetical protein